MKHLKHIPWFGKASHTIVIVCLCFLLSNGYSQSIPYGKIRGKVVDEATQSGLPLVNIMIEGTEIGTAADTAGNYIIQRVPPGIYNIKFMMMGYEYRIVNNVVVNPNRTTWQKIELKPSLVEGESITVTAGYFHQARDGVVSNRSMDFEEIRIDPGSAEDIQRVVQALPAVVSGADQDNEIIVNIRETHQRSLGIYIFCKKQ